MKVEDIRNVGIVGHGGVGKTILAEAMLYSAGITNRMGSIEDGNTISDFHNQEIQRQISITTAMLHLNWRDHKINMIDTPGYLDFVGEVYGTMHVVDTGLLVIDASHGIEVGTEICWKYGKEHNLSKIIVANKCDKDDINWDRLIDDFREYFGPDVVMVQFPYNSGPNFNKIIDLLRGKMLVYATDGSGKVSEEDIPADAMEAYKAARLTFMESIIEHDEELMTKYLSDEPVSESELKKALSYACKHNQIYPVVCCAAKKNVGVSRILDLIVNYGASASDLPDMSGKDENGQTMTRKCDAGEPMASLIFKTVSEPHVGELSFVKVYSGTLKVGMDVFNPTTRATERISGLFLINGKDRKDTPQIECGDMGAIIKLKNSHTNNTLSAPNAPIELDPIQFPEPVIRAALHTLNKGDEDRVATGLNSLHQEDPTFHYHFDPELRQTIVSGQGELQLDVIVTRLKNRFNVDTELIEPRIPYRETITKTADFRKKYKKQTGGRGQYADVHLEIKPLERGSGFEFIDNIVGGVIPGKYIPAIEKGIRNTMEEGYLTDSKIIDISARVYDGSYHNVDSSDLAFQIAGAQAFKECMEKAGPIILEPIYKLEIRVPDEYMGTVMGDISSRRGKVQGMDTDGKMQVIRAEVPLAELYKYSSSLRSMTQGRGVHHREFGHYEPVPRDVQKKLVETHQQMAEAEA
ncbi:MAG: elongation factor G [Acidobacteria bacterium]|nr:elongation factor G [Acidobacteriota bacterium]MCB9399572.1 elongation factor G [Acidobacteriota bacterium]